MIKTLLKIDGMACSMCECHICDAIRGTFSVVKINASHKKGEVTLITDSVPNEEQLTACVNATGYTVLSVSHAPYEKKRFSFF